jgi:hypothetical protein
MMMIFLFCTMRAVFNRTEVGVVNWPVAILYSSSRIGESVKPSPRSCGEPHSPHNWQRRLISCCTQIALWELLCIFLPARNIHARRITESIKKSVIGPVLKVEMFLKDEVTTFVRMMHINALVYCFDLCVNLFQGCSWVTDTSDSPQSYHQHINADIMHEENIILCASV